MRDIDFNQHHAYLLLDQGDAVSKLHSLLQQKLKFNTSLNPDYWFEEIETFGIEESRRLKEAHMKKAIGGEIKVFAVKTKFITNEAQNALLKILEDPLPGAVFFFLMPSKEYVFPTLLSRFMVVKEGSEKKRDVTEKEFDADYFLRLNPAARIKALTKSPGFKDKEAAINIVNSLEEKLREKYYPTFSEEAREALEFLLKSREYMYSRSASLKIILENLSLTLPKIV